MGTRESLNGRKNIYGTKKSKERREEPLGTMSYRTSSKRSPLFWLLIGARKLVFFWHQSEARTARPFGTGLVRHCPQGLFSPFFTFLCATFFRPFRLSLVPTICPWVSEDGWYHLYHKNLFTGIRTVPYTREYLSLDANNSYIKWFASYFLPRTRFCVIFAGCKGNPAWHVRLEGVYMEVGDPG